jgi:glycosyltransferase involved in cell wall biosynthesis
MLRQARECRLAGSESVVSSARLRGGKDVTKEAIGMSLRIVVGIPTVGRARILQDTLRELARQTRVPDRIVVCGTRDADVAGAAAEGAEVMLAPAGLPRQRNAIIDAAMAADIDADIVMFFDDDFLAHPDYLAAIERHMLACPSTVVATGAVLADGINGPGLSPAEGRAIIAAGAAHDSGERPVFTGYGCNMAVRLAPMRLHCLRFDERLPLYGWQEDVDLSRCLAAFGNIIHVGAARGVHLGVKLGRGAGLRLGYSQVANPFYLSGKRRGYPWRRAVGHVARNVAKNILRATWPEPYIDRRGRLRGNVLALRDLLTGRMIPERILDL